ncbi:MAG: GNAT family N-acetyltransferase [Candidatus Thorarchaeota archaeon]
MKEPILESKTVQLYPFSNDDLELMMAWRSHPEVYRYFLLQEGPLIWEDHYRFWNSRQDRYDWIINYDDGICKRKVGSINVSKLSSEEPEVGIFIGEITLMKKGIGKEALRLIVEWLKGERYGQACAYISKDNLPSQKLFSSLGFKKSAEAHNGVEWKYVISFGSD